MSRKILVKLIAASFALVGIDAAMACSTAAWTNTGTGGGEVGNPTEGEPYDATGVRRYSGRCGLRATAAASFVRDVSPAAEPKYRARFYAFAGLTGGAGEAVVFRAADASDASKIRVSYDTGANAFKIYTGADATADATVPAAEGAWYAVELNFSNAAPAELRYTIHGAGSSTPIANDQAITAGIAGTDVIDSAELGWVSNITAGGTGEVTTDAFESRRNTAIGRLCRADSNNDNAINVGDRVSMTNEILRTAGLFPAPGQPDCNEDGLVNVGDRVCVTNRILASNTCP